MKRFVFWSLSIAVLLFVLMGTLNEKAEAATTYTAGYYTYSVEDGVATITDVDTSISGRVVIPSEINGYPVTGIGNKAFYECALITGLTIPNQVTDIGQYAFYRCSRLTDITLPEGITKLKDYAFCECSALSKVTIPDGVTNIGAYAFYKCSALKSINIPDSVVSIGSGAFDGCTGLQGVYINDLESWLKIDFATGYYSSVSSNPLYCAGKLFVNGELVTDLVIPDGTTTIKKYAFYNCTALTSVALPDSLTQMGDYVFYGCTGLAYNIYDNAKYLGNNENPYLVFISAIDQSVTEMTLHQNTQIICNNALKGCAALTNITIPEGVTQIGNYAFSGCSGLTSISIPEKVIVIGECAFQSCTGIKTLYYNAINCTQIGSSNYNAFSGCTGINTIHIGEKVTQTPAYAFSGCTKVQSVHTTDLEAWCKINFNSAPLPQSGNLYVNGVRVTELVIPDGIDTIGRNVFYNCASITSVTIPDSVKSIDYAAFAGCANLKAVYIEDLKKWCEIDFGGYCANPVQVAKNLYVNGELLTKLVIPEEITQIKQYAFCGSKSLSSVTSHNGIVSIGDYAFYGNTSLSSVTLHDGIVSIGSYAFGECTGLEAVYIEDIDAWWSISFENGSSNPLGYASLLYANEEPVTEVIVPEGTISINARAFCGYKALESITIPDSVTEIGASAFSGCSMEKVCITDLAAWCNIDFDNADANPLYHSEYLYLNGKQTTDIVIPNGVQNIKFAAFYGYANMTSLAIPGSVTTIGHSAFIYCSNIEKIHIADIVAWCNIDFYYYDSTPFYSSPNAKLCLNGQEITQLVIPNGVEEIKYGAFCNCDGIESISLPVSLTNIESYAFYLCDSLNTVYYQGNVTEKSEISLGSYNVINDAAWYYNACISKENHSLVGLECSVCQQSFEQISFITDGGVVYQETLVPLGLSYQFTSDTPTKDGYNFAGWSYVANGDIAYTIGDVLTVQESITLYAQWNKRCATCGGDKKIDCTSCSGTGKIQKICSACDGKGYVYVGSNHISLCEPYTYSKCTLCSGKGYKNCAVCDENGEVIRNNVSAPKAPVVESVDATSVVLQAITNGEYSIDRTNWQTSPVFENLEEGKKYSFYQRYAKTDTTYTSASSSALIALVHQHVFDNACDALCNLCEYTRTVPDHVYDHGCDTACNVCGYTRTTTHIYDNNCDAVCNECGSEREVPDHIYDNGCDTECNECSLVRAVPDHIYDNACDTNCNECGLERSVPDHVYDNVCDADCNVCYFTREVGPHFVGEGVAHILSNDPTYPFALTDDWYDSTNKSNSSSSTFTLAAKHNCTLVVAYRVSSEKYYDAFVIKNNSSTLVSATGSVSETEIAIILTEGDILTFTYSKSSYGSSGTDTASFRFVDGICSIDADALEADCVNAVVCSGCGITVKPVSEEHNYDNACDATCNICGFVRTVPEHSYILNGNHTCDICMFSKTPAAPVVGSKTNSSVTLLPTDGFEYSKDGTTWQTSNVFTDLSADTTYTFYQRVKASISAVVSETSQGTTVVFKSAQAAPSAPIVSSFTDTKVTLIPVNGCEYSVDGTTWQSSNIFIGLSAATQYTIYQRYAETQTHEASNATQTSVTMDKAKQTLIPTAPTVESFTSSSITLVPVDGCEYSKNGKTWQTDNVFAYLSCGTEYTFYQRYKETATTYAGKASESLVAKTDKGTQSKPSAPTLSSKTYNSVTLYARSGYEYSRDGVTWQTSNVFTGLEAETNYMFYQRKAETATYYASEASAVLTVKTDEAPLYMPGDLDSSEGVDEDDVIYLLQYLLMPEDFPVSQPVDYDHNNVIDEDDVIYLLQHLLMPEDFPL